MLRAWDPSSTSFYWDGKESDPGSGRNSAVHGPENPGECHRPGIHPHFQFLGWKRNNSWQGKDSAVHGPENPGELTVPGLCSLNPRNHSGIINK